MLKLSVMAVNLFLFLLLFCDSSVYKIGSQTEAFEVLRKQRYYGYGYSTTVLGYTSTVLYSFLVGKDSKNKMLDHHLNRGSTLLCKYQLFYLFYYLVEFFLFFIL